MQMSSNPLDVVIVSAIGVDTNIYLYGQDIDFSVEANFSQNLDYVGQAGGYSSRGFARLGYQTAFAGYIGEDFNGKFVASELASDGIESLLFIDPQGTRRSINFMNRDGIRKNFYDAKGAMNLKAENSLIQALFQRARLAHFNIENWARYLLPLAREAGLKISCDIQDIVALDDPYRRDFIDAADFLFFSGVNFNDPTPLIQELLRRNLNQIIVVGMGKKGCALGSRDGIRFFPPVEMAEAVVDTNGAGDALTVGFLSSYCLEGYSLEDSVLRGQIAARYTCTIKASSADLINRGELNYYFSKIKRNGT
ncbi:carbohydrate kinase family protein [Candidatus Chlorohelix sp.]|uniref:carbohydrate kinase family protein n=1 Tax=Candidatus Chlorohelix sp. TaxID=3139201 RepID=UPI00305E4B72